MTPELDQPADRIVHRSRWAAVGAAIAVTLGAAGIGSYNIASADVSEGDRAVYVAIAPCRLLDTRSGTPNVGAQLGPLGADQTVTIDVANDSGQCTGDSAIPSDAESLALNVTAVGQTERTFLTLWGDGDDPGTSNLNPEPGEPPTPNAVTTPLSDTNTFNIRNNAGDVNVIADAVGYYVGHNHDDRYYTEVEVDAAIESAVADATAAPTRRRLGAYDLAVSPAGGAVHTFAIPAGTIRFDAGEVGCIGASLDLTGATSLDAIEVHYFGQEMATELLVIVETLPTTDGLTNVLVDRLIDEQEVDIASDPTFATRSVRIEAEPRTLDVAENAYALNICGGDGFTMYAVDVMTS